MLYPTSPTDAGRRRLILAGLVTLSVLLVSVTYTVWTHRTHHPTDAGSQSPPVNIHQTTPTNTADPTSPSRLPRSSDPERFAREVAEALFAWDTTTLVTRADRITQLLTLADPTGESTAGLLSDLGHYLPTPAAWTDLTRYQTRQWLTITSVTTPTLWADAVAQAGDALAAGTTAFTIDGTRHRAGVWENQPVASEHQVAFTVFIVCTPTYRTCHLLRLSILDQPLD